MKKYVRYMLSVITAAAIIVSASVMPSADSPDVITTLQNDETGRMYISKNVSDNGDGTFTVDVLSYITDARSSYSKIPGMDIILMVDRSNSMAVRDGTSSSRKSRAVDAVHDFLLGNGSSGGLADMDMDDVSLYAYTFAGHSVTTAVEDMKLRTAGDCEEAYEKVRKSMTFLRTYTCTDKALRKCRETAEDNLACKSGNRLQMVILVTDGLPGQPIDLWWVNDCGLYADVWDCAVREANLLKSLENTKLLTISMIPSLDTGEGNNADLASRIASISYPKKKAALVLLNVLSSDWTGTDEHMFSNGTYLDREKWGTPSVETGYYRSATTSSDISDIMIDTVENVAENADVSPDMTAVSVIRDGVSECFEICGNSERAYLYSYQRSADNERIFRKTSEDPGGYFSCADNGKIEYSGFDYEANAVCGSDNSGSLLDIQYVMRPKDEFLGGKNIPINLKSGSINLCGAYCSAESPVPDYPANEPDADVKLSEIFIRNPKKTVCFSGVYSDNFLSQNAEYEYMGRWSGRIYPIRMYDDDMYNSVWWELNSGFVKMYDSLLSEKAEEIKGNERCRLAECFENFRNESTASMFLSDTEIQYRTEGRTIEVSVPFEDDSISLEFTGGQSVWIYSLITDGEYNPYSVREQYDNCRENEGLKYVVRNEISSEFIDAKTLFFTFKTDESTGDFYMSDISTGGESYFDPDIGEFRVSRNDAVSYPIYSTLPVYAGSRRDVLEMYDTIFSLVCDSIADDMENDAVSQIESTQLFLAEKEMTETDGWFYGTGDAFGYLSGLPAESNSMSEEISGWEYTMTGYDLTGNVLIDALVNSNKGSVSQHSFSCSDSSIEELKEMYSEMLTDRSPESLFYERMVSGYNHGLEEWVNRYVSFGDIQISGTGSNAGEDNEHIRITDVSNVLFSFLSGDDKCAYGTTEIEYSGSLTYSDEKTAIVSASKIRVLYPVSAYTCIESDSMPEESDVADAICEKLTDVGAGEYFPVPCSWEIQDSFSFNLSNPVLTERYINYLEPEMEWELPYNLTTVVSGRCSTPDFSPSYSLEREDHNGTYLLRAEWGDGYPFYVTEFFSDESCGVCSETIEPDGRTYTVGRVHVSLPDLYFPVTFRKSGCDDELDNDMTFMFRICGEQKFDGDTVETPLFPVHSGCPAVYMLKAGTYLLYEESCYSPMYTSDCVEFTVEVDGTVVSDSNEICEVVMVNTRDIDYAETGNDWNDNVFKKSTGLFESASAGEVVQ